MKAQSTNTNPDAEDQHARLISKYDITDDDIKQVRIEQLSLNPENLKLYAPEINEGLKASIEERGVLVPIRITRDHMIIDGHQRCGAATECGFTSIPSIFVDIKPENYTKEILDCNRGRVCTVIESLREFREYQKIESMEAHQRAGKRMDLVQESALGEAHFGKSRDLAAKKVGLSGYHACLGLKILEHIEKREADGKSDHVDKVKNALNKSINRGYKMALALGWLDPAVKPNSNDSTLKVASPLQVDKNTQESAKGWMTDEQIESAIIQSQAPKSGHQAIKQTLLEIRSAIYGITGPNPTKPGANKLRCLAGVLMDLASHMALVQAGNK